MKIKDGYLLRKFGEDYVAVSVDEATDGFNGLITLNDTGAFIWELLSERDCSKDFLVSEMINKYDVDAETAKDDINLFLVSVRNSGLLNE